MQIITLRESRSADSNGWSACLHDRETFRRAPLDRVAAGMSPLPADTSGKYVTQVAVASGAIVVTYGNDANAVITGQTLGLTPFETGDLSVAWKCGGALQPAGTALMGTQGALGIAVENNGTLGNNANFHRYLPSACRP
jgi:hypothetical protein